MNQLTQTMSTDASVSNLRGLKRFGYLIKKLGIYLFRYSKHPRYLYLYLTRSLSGGYKEAVQFIDNETFLALAKNRSTIRFGDGEFGMLIDGRGIHFQPANPKLIAGLRKILTEYRDQSTYLLGLNPHIAIANRVLSKWNVKYGYMQQKLGYFLHVPKDAWYFSASIFYLDNWSKKFLATLSDRKSVVLVANDRLLQKVKASELFPAATTTTMITVPEIDAFAEYDEIIKKICTVVQSDSVVFVSAGPAGKIMIHELAASGVLAHDIGHGLQFAIEGGSQEHLIRWDEAETYFETTMVSTR